MAKLSVSVDVPLPPEQAWAAASDLSRYKEWLSIHRMWRTKPPEAMTLDGAGKGGVKVKLIGRIKPAENNSEASTVQFDLHLGGPALFGPIGMIVAGELKSDIQESLNKFKTVFA